MCQENMIYLVAEKCHVQKNVIKKIIDFMVQ